MQLRTARLCLDCEEVHDEGQCPVCASETFTYLSRWVPSDERRRRPRAEAPAQEPRAAESAARIEGEFEAYRRLSTGDVKQPAGRHLLRKGVMGLAAVGVVGWLWGRKDSADPKARRQTGN
jgi:predicted  nucleic acid-binding Zn-ribbon protein